MDLLNLGSQSRKTGLKPRKNLRKDKYNMEDLDDFFEDDSGDDKSGSSIGEISRYKSNRPPRAKSSYKPRESSIIPRMINFTDAEAEKFDLSPIMIEKEKKNSLKSPLSEQEPASPKLFVEEESGQEVRKDTDQSQSNPMELIDDNQADGDMMEDNFDNGDDGYGYDDLNNDFLDNEAGELGDAGDVNEGMEEIPQDGYESEDIDVSRRTIASLTKNMALGKATKSKIMRSKSVRVSTPKQITVRPSPLPSPPPDGLRRSKRTRIQPLAFWRNERIIYSRSNDDEDDPDTTLISDIRKIPLQEIKEIIHVPMVTQERKRSTSRSPKLGSSKKMKKSPGSLNVKNSKKVASVEEGYDYESDPEVEGSEWFKNNSLNISVFGEDDTEVEKTIALTQDFSDRLQDPPRSAGSIDNYRIAPIFNDDPNVAGALFEFPKEGFKSSKNSGECIYMFHVIRGLLEVNISNQTFVVTRGCSFQVPAYNTYGITNIGNGIGKLFCAQALIHSEDKEPV